MRYKKLITFVVEEGEKYNPETSEYESDLVKTPKRANVTDLGTDRSVKLFGDIKEGAKVVRLLRPYNDKWDCVIIDGLTYNITTQRDTRLRDGFIVKEVFDRG